MKRIIPFFLIAITVILYSCSKSSEPARIINCDGLITDTLGTGDNGRVYMPNAFSPNYDGLNDLIRPVTQNIASIIFTIYDQNNVVIYTTTVLGQGWQPNNQGSNVAKKYYYKIQATTISNKKIGLCGDLYSLSCFPVNPPRSFYYFEDMLTPNGFTGVTNEQMPTCN